METSISSSVRRLPRSQPISASKLLQLIMSGIKTSKSRRGGRQVEESASRLISLPYVILKKCQRENFLLLFDFKDVVLRSSSLST